MGEDKNVWDRPWSVEEMRDSANNWSLASDAGMLQHLQEFSQRMIARTHEIQQQVNGLVHEAKLSNVRVHSAFNEFIMLANTQFVENRVYDEDVTGNDKDVEKGEEKDKTKEEREAELIPKISQAVKLGLSVIDTAFEKLEVNPGNSDSEDEQAYVPEPLLEAKDPYIHRALPYIIGSQSFMQDDDVGLIDMPSEDEEQAEESETESEESESESESGDDSNKQAAPQQRKVLDKFDSETDSDEDDLFGDNKKFSEDEEVSESDQDEEESTSGEEESAVPAQNVPPPAGDFASELAAKLGLPGQTQPQPAPAATNQTETHTESSEKRKGKKQAKKESARTPAAQEDDDGDLFSAPRSDLFADDDDDSPFGSGGGLFSTSKKVTSLFDDDEGGLFDDVTTTKQPPSQPAKAEPPKQPTPGKQPSPAPSPKVTKSGKKIPAGGVSIFGDDEDDLFSGVQPSSNNKKPASSLFDEDDEDLFDSVVSAPKSTNTGMRPNEPQLPKTQATSKPSKAASLFDESDKSESDEDLFADKPKPKLMESPRLEERAQTEQTPEASKKKLPPGAVSMFGNAPNPLLAAMKAKHPPQTDSEEDSDWSEDEPISNPPQQTNSATNQQLGLKSQPTVVKPSPISERKKGLEKEVSPAPSSKSLFDDEEDDDLFSVGPPKAKTSIAKPSSKAQDPLIQTNKKQPEKPAGALFGDDPDSADDGDLFSAVAAPAKPKEKTTPQSKPPLLGGEEEEEDLFAAQPPPQSSGKKKPAGGVALFGGADMFGGGGPLSKDKPAPIATVKPTTEDQAKPKPLETKPKPNRGVSLFDADSEEEEDLFAAISSAPKHKQAPSKKQNLGLFGEDEDMFSAQTQEPEVDLFDSRAVNQKSSATKVPSSSAQANVISSAQRGPSDISTVAIKGATISSSTTDQDLFGEEEQAKPEEVKPKKPPAGAVSMFGGLDPSQLVNKSKPVTADEKPAKTDPLLSTSPDEDDLFTAKPSVSKQPPVGPPPFAAKPDNAALNRKAEDRAKPTGAVSKLKSHLAFNPATMLPGAAPPPKEPEVAVVGFDEPASAQTLSSVAKDRAKIQRNRRPQSRKARAAAVRQSQHGDNMIDSIVNQPPMSIQGEEEVIQSKSRIPKTTPSKPLVQSREPISAGIDQRIPDLSDNDGLFSDINVNETVTKPKPLLQDVNKVKVDTKADLLSDDIFGNVSTSKSQSSQKSSSKASDKVSVDDPMISNPEQEATEKVSSWLKTSKPVTQASRQTPLDDDDDDDIFSSQSKGTPTGQISSQKMTTEASKVAETQRTSIKSKGGLTEKESTNDVSSYSRIPPPLKVSSVEGDFEDEDTDLFENSAVNKDDDDLFTSKKSKSSKEKNETDPKEDDDLFAFPKAEKSKPPTFYDEDDDIFGNSSILTKPISKKKRNTDNIFDDVLQSSETEPRSKQEVPFIPEPDTQTSSKPPTITTDDDIFGDDFLSTKATIKTNSNSADKVNSGQPIERESDRLVAKTKAKPQSGGVDEDDIFADIPVSKPRAPAAVKMSDDDIFGDVTASSNVTKAPAPDDDDIFADAAKEKKKTTKKPKKAVVKDEDIFKDDTDIFTDIPAAKPKEKKSKKKAAAAKPIFTNNDVDDIFSSTTTSGSKSTKAKKSKKAEPAKTNSRAAGDVDDIFDDPLSAFK